MKTFGVGLSSLVLLSILSSCPGGGSSSSPTLTGKISNYSVTAAGVIKVYAVTNPRSDLSVSPLSYVSLTSGATVIAEGTVSATGDFSLQLPSDTTMSLSAKPRVLPSMSRSPSISRSPSMSRSPSISRRLEPWFAWCSRPSRINSRTRQN